MTVSEQHEEIDRRIIELLDSILDVSIDSTKGQIIHMVKNLRDSLDRRKK
jgi:hypothetical protein